MQAQFVLHDFMAHFSSAQAQRLAARTLDRILDVFPVDQQEQIRIMISESLIAITTRGRSGISDLMN